MTLKKLDNNKPNNDEQNNRLLKFKKLKFPIKKLNNWS
jgi:hypothetical protein